MFIENFSIENSSKVEFFICGIYINGVLYRARTKLLVKKDYAAYFNFDMALLALVTVDELRLYIEDVIGYFYTMQLNFSDNNGNITITGNKPIQFTGERNE